MWQKLTNYLKETKIEMKRVRWPSRKDSVRFTITVIAVSLGVAAVLGAFDWIFTNIIKLFLIK